MIPIKTMREEFGLAERITKNVFRAELETRAAITHYYFRSVRSERPDLLATSRGSNDEDFAVRFLESLAARLTKSEFPPGKVGIKIENGYGFDAALILTPEYHGHLKGILDDKRESLVYCVPIHDCEFSRNESPLEYREWQVRVDVENWARKPFPFVSMDNGNSKSGSGGMMTRTSVDACMNTLKVIDGVADRAVVISNAWTQTMRIAPQAGRVRIAISETPVDECTVDEFAVILDSFVTKNELRLGKRR